MYREKKRKNRETLSLLLDSQQQSPRARVVGPHRCRRRRRLVYRRHHHLYHHPTNVVFESSNAIRRREDDIEHRFTSWERYRQKAGGRSEKEGDARIVFSMGDIRGRCENVERASVVFSFL